MKMKMTVLALVMAITPQTRAAIYRAFRPDEFELVWAATPSEALEASTRRPPGLVLLDLDQPVPARQVILENLRRLNPSAPMVVLADHSAAQDEALADQKVAILYKPFGAGVLADAANVLLKVPSNNSVPPVGKDADVWGAKTNSERTREMLLARYHTPFEFTPSYRQRG